MSKLSNMLIPTVSMALLAVVLFFIAYARGGQHWAGLRASFRIILEILPLLLFSLIVAGLVQVLLPREALARWVGDASGIRGLLIGTVAGGFAPGGPYVSLPLAAGLMRAGAGMGTMVAFLTAWSLWGVSRLPMEIGLLGWKFSLIRLVSTFFFPPLAGLLAQMIQSAAR